MKKFTVLSLLAATVLFLIATSLSVETSGHSSKLRLSRNPVPNRFMVMLNEDQVGRDVTAPAVEAEARYLSAVYGGEVRDVYSNALKGYVATMSLEQAQALSQDDRVLLVEQDAVISLSETQSSAPWNLDRVDQRNLPLDTTFSYSQNGAGSHIYIIDTGIRITHQEFGGRATAVYDGVFDGQNGIDCHGHGTHVAGTAAGMTYGVAKGAQVHAMRVLNCQASGMISAVVGAVDWLTANRVNPAVANISLIAAGSSPMMESAIEGSVASGVVFVVSAGNSGANACDYTPSRVPSAITVGATAQNDARAGFSNFGSCVDVFAPGTQVVSAAIQSNSAIGTLSGTSMAAPLVAGVAAVYRGGNPSANPAAVFQAMNNAVTTGVVSNIDATSPNKLLYSWLSGAPSPTPTPTPTATLTPTPTPTPSALGRVTIRKRIQNPNGGPSSTTAFPYQATNIPTTNFSLANNQEFTDPSVPGSSQTVAVTEASVAGWRLLSIVCTEVAGGTPNSANTTVDLANQRANIRVEDGETVTCEFTSEEIVPTAGDAMVSGRVLDQLGRGVRGVHLSLFDPQTGEERTAMTNSMGFYYFDELEVGSYYVVTAFARKRFSIANPVRSFLLTDELVDVDFYAEGAF